MFKYLTITFLVQIVYNDDQINAKREFLMRGGWREALEEMGKISWSSRIEKKVSDTRLKGPLSAKPASEGIHQMGKGLDLTKPCYQEIVSSLYDFSDRSSQIV